MHREFNFSSKNSTPYVNKGMKEEKKKRKKVMQLSIVIIPDLSEKIKMPNKKQQIC